MSDGDFDADEMQKAAKVNRKQVLIDNWLKLRNEAEEVMNRHKDFKKYNNIRLQMCRIADTLYKVYGVTELELIYMPSPKWLTGEDSTKHL